MARTTPATEQDKLAAKLAAVEQVVAGHESVWDEGDHLSDYALGCYETTKAFAKAIRDVISD